MLEQVADSELSELPANSPLRDVCPETLDLVRRIDSLIAHLSDEKGYAELHIFVRRGEPGRIRVIRDFNLATASE